MQEKKKDWIVRVFDKDGNTSAHFYLYNLTEKQANKDAQSFVRGGYANECYNWFIEELDITELRKFETDFDIKL